jgi:ParB family chromosome partitioning protein
MSSKPLERRSVGRGLEELMRLTRNPAAEPPRGGATKIAIELIRPDGRQPRQRFDGAALEELARSVKQQGVLQPVLVRRDGKGYRLIAGERRWRARRPRRRPSSWR